MSKRTPELYISDILDAIERIKAYVSGMTFEAFEVDEKTVDAVLKNFSVIGEAIRNISEFQDRYPDIPWPEIIGMRNKIIHDYFSIDKEVVWKTIIGRIPELESQIRKITLKK